MVGLRTSAQGPQIHQAPHFELGVLDSEVACDEAPPPKLNDLPPHGSTSGTRVSLSLPLEIRASAPSTLPRRSGCIRNQAHQNLGPPHIESSSRVKQFSSRNLSGILQVHEPQAQAPIFRFFGFEEPSSVFGQSRAQ